MQPVERKTITPKTSNAITIRVSLNFINFVPFLNYSLSNPLPV
jgi:hypothetical protein